MIERQPALPGMHDLVHSPSSLRPGTVMVTIAEPHLLAVERQVQWLPVCLRRMIWGMIGGREDEERFTELVICFRENAAATSCVRWWFCCLCLRCRFQIPFV